MRARVGLFLTLGLEYDEPNKIDCCPMTPIAVLLGCTLIIIKYPRYRYHIDLANCPGSI